MTTGGTKELTILLKAWGAGDHSALNKLTPLVYDELRRMARRYMRKERTGNTLQTTALINEAYLRLVDIQSVGWQDRAHFFAVSAQLMRRILVDGARLAAQPSAVALAFAWIIRQRSIWTRYQRLDEAPNWLPSMMRSMPWPESIREKHMSSNCVSSEV